MMFETAHARERAHCRRIHRLFLGFGIPFLMWCLAPPLAAQERDPAPKFEMRPAYPRTNLSTAYEVVSSWPARPKNLTWGALAGIAISPSNQIWTFNRGTVPVQVYTAGGELVRSWGQGQFREPHQVRIDHDGGIWLVDSGLHVVKKFTAEGKLLLTLGTAGESGEDSTHLNRPTDVAVAPGGDTFVTDGYGNNRIVHFDERGRFVETWGSLGSGPGEFSLPHSIALDSRGRLFVADRNNARVQVFDQAGRFLDEWRDLVVPWHIVVTERDEIYVCGSSPMRWPKLPIPGLIVGIPPKDQLIMVFTPDGRVTRLITFPKGQRPGELDWVHALAVDRRGDLYLGDIQGKRAQKFLRLEPAGREGHIAKEARPKRDDPVQRAGKP
jgi:DNA-binding beta-propeller fold protein YncE